MHILVKILITVGLVSAGLLVVGVFLMLIGYTVLDLWTNHAIY